MSQMMSYYLFGSDKSDKVSFAKVNYLIIDWKVHETIVNVCCRYNFYYKIE